MQIDFYEEFPTKDNLEKLKLIKFKSRIFIAAKSLSEFNKIAKQAKRINKNLKYACWLIIKNSYWISPFSNTEDLKRLFSGLNKAKICLLVDLEMPLNKGMIIKNLFVFIKNRKLIEQYLEENKKKITTAQFPPLLSKSAKFIGLDYCANTEKSLMYYSSILSVKMNKYIKRILPKIKNKQNYSVSLGTIAKGIFGNEPILSPKNLEKDLKFIKKIGFDKAIIFRLGGLNKNYIKVINKFI
ncbi:hypothetical protein HYT26_00205 [Candidatus Pacearchaeota archaeon]|nr:hypothetical protein [Candidatus Pacearchaeota archaeon]